MRGCLVFVLVTVMLDPAISLAGRLPLRRLGGFASQKNRLNLEDKFIKRGDASPEGPPPHSDDSYDPSEEHSLVQTLMGLMEEEFEWVEELLQNEEYKKAEAKLETIVDVLDFLYYHVHMNPYYFQATIDDISQELSPTLNVSDDDFSFAQDFSDSVTQIIQETTDILQELAHLFFGLESFIYRSDEKVAELFRELDEKAGGSDVDEHRSDLVVRGAVAGKRTLHALLNDRSRSSVDKGKELEGLYSLLTKIENLKVR